MAVLGRVLEIVPGAPGFPEVVVTAMLVEELGPHSFSAITEMVPEGPAVTLMEFVPVPPVMVHPEGTVQV